jgi:hypothetical protein
MRGGRTSAINRLEQIPPSQNSPLRGILGFTAAILEDRLSQQSLPTGGREEESPGAFGGIPEVSFLERNIGAVPGRNPRGLYRATHLV